MRPASMMAMRVPIFSASSRSWLTKMMVRFSCRCSSSSSSCSLVRISGSSAENGSSMSRIGASVAKARARPTRCCMPPESSCAYLPAHGARPTSSSCFVDARAARSRLRHAGELQPEADILRDRAPGQQRELLEHHGDAVHADAAERRPGRMWRRRPSARSSCTRTLPRTGRFRPLTARISVDLPEPERPISTRDLALADIERAIGDAEDRAAVFARISVRVAPWSSSASPSRGALAEDDVDVLEGDGGGAHFGAFSLAARRIADPADAVEDDGEHDDGEARLDAHRDVDGVERPHHRLAEAVGADQRRDHHHGEAEHDALREARP